MRAKLNDSLEKLRAPKTKGNKFMLRKSRLWIIAVTAIVAVLTLVCVFATAANEPTVEIRLNNISYKQNVFIKYAVEVENLPDDATVGVKIEKGGAAGEAVFVGLSNIYGKQYYVFDVVDLTANEMAVDIYATPYIEKADGKYVYGETKKCSVLEYTYKILGKIEGGVSVSDQVKTLLTRMLDYGAAVQEYTGLNLDRLATADYYQITTVGGVLSDGFTSGLYKKGDVVTLEAVNIPEGYMLAGWRSSVDGSLITDSVITVTDENVVYTAEYKPAGNFGKISYVLDEGTLPDDAQYEYDKDAAEAYVLPIPTKSGYAFSGWYTTPGFGKNSIISEIPANATSDYTLYAKWNKEMFVYTAGNHEISIGSREYSSLASVTNANGEQVLRWNKTSGGPISLLTYTPLSGGSRLTMAKALDGAKRFTFTFTLSSPTDSAQEANFRLMSKDDSMGLRVFTVNANGAILLGSDSNSVIVSKLTSEATTFSVLVDFDAALLSAYNEDGRCIATTKFTAQTTYDTWDAWYENTLNRYYDWYSKETAAGTIDIHAMALHIGDSAYRINDAGYSTDELNQIITSLQSQNSGLEASYGALPQTVVSYKMEHTGSSYSYGGKWAWLALGQGSTNAMRSDWGILDASSPYALTQRTGAATYDARMLLNNETIAKILANMNDPEYEHALDGLLSLARTDCDGVLGTPADNYKGMSGIHNYDASILAVIEAKALMYRLMYEQDLEPGSIAALERDMYGYQAIIAIKNYLLTLSVETNIGDDASRYHGYIMYTAAEVYDWCKPLLSATDKDQIIRGVVEKCCTGKTGDGSKNKISVGYPPISDQTFTGTSSELMILRDYLSFAIAIYDEDPSWYNYIASGVLERFVPGRVYYFESGMTHQGVSNYVRIRHVGDLFAAWLLHTATGNNPYTGIENTMISVLGNQLPDGTSVFKDGDGNNPKIQYYSSLALMASAICEKGGFEHNADVLYTWFCELNGGIDTHSKSTLYETTYATFFVFALQGQERNADKYEGLDAIQYNGSPLGQMISRSEWGNANAAATYMKIKERHTSNHEHNDAGTFQIYYKGLLTGDSGIYGGLTSNHYEYYHTATVAHNGILVYDPSQASTLDGCYTGGQREPGPKASGGHWENWLNNVTGNYDSGKVTGVQYGYKDAAEKLAKYAYIAGDVTAAYDTDTQVTHVERRMLTVYTDNADFPMVFFVYDDVEAKSAGFETKFLLHVNTEDAPTVDGNTVTISNGEGQLVLTCLTSYARIDELGGRVYDASNNYDSAASSNYLVNGKQLESGTKEDGSWGRVEIVSTEKATKMLNVIYVTDAGQTKTAPAITRITGTNVEGGVFGNTAAVFMTSRTRVSTAQSFTVSGSGDMDYYVSGVAAGVWTVSVGGTTQTVTATDDGGMLVFTAPAGTVTITPAN